ISRVTTLHRGLRQSLRQKLEESNDSLFSLTYDQYVETMQSAERRSKRFQPSQSSQSSQSSQPSQSSHQSNRNRFSQRMDIDPIRVNSFRPVFTPSRSRSSSTSSSSSADRREYRLLNDLCLCCGSATHWIESCPESRSARPASPTRPASSARLARPASPAQPRTKTTARSPAMDALFRSKKGGAIS
ncbi:hypothetical protein COCC4DRAFT_155635, partial [Bipolaris maydis ATCC 48331]